MKRRPTTELLDVDVGTPAQIATALSDLRHINAWFGGVRTTRLLIEETVRTLRKRKLSLLEVASGSGFVPRKVADRIDECDISITLLDRVPSHLLNGDSNDIRHIAADALALPFTDNSFDLVSCCLFVHHLSPHEVIRFTNEALRVSRHAVLINDLIRHPIHLAMAYASLPLYRSHFTHHDAPASVRQAYTVEEMRSMLQKTIARKVEIQRHSIFRMGVIAWK